MMNCPHCQTLIDEHEANPCLDRWIEEVLMDGEPSKYSTDIAAAWKVHEKQIGKLFSKRRRYLLALEKELREREKHIVAWPDALIFLSPLTLCRAALKAIYVGEDEK